MSEHCNKSRAEVDKKHRSDYEGFLDELNRVSTLMRDRGKVYEKNLEK